MAFRMRMFSSALALTALAAACTPSTFEHITGGKKPDDTTISPHASDQNKTDPTLAAPRQISPLSTAWVNTTKPHLRWSLASGTSGATIELAQTRDFATVLHKYVATGSDFVVTDDLAPGPWFWRLTGRSDTNPGEKTSPVWEIYVRGGGPLGASEAPHVGIVDTNADGHPDVTIDIVSKYSVDPNSVATENFPELWIALANPKDDTYAPYDNNDPYDTPSSSPAIAPTDLDGDGYGDIFIADIYTPTPPDPPGPAEGYMFPYFGGGDGGGPSDDELDYFSQPFSHLPGLAPGDFNGDGYGDASAAFETWGAAMLGNPEGGGPSIAFDTSVATVNPTALLTRAVASADFDGDGISDVAYSPFDTASPIRIAAGGISEFAPSTGLTFTSASTPTRATAIGAGDFDGDGVDDVAFTTTLAGKNAVCVHGMTDSSFSEKACWMSTTADATADFGLTLLAADLDADGKDELLVVSKSGMIALTHKGTGKGFSSDDSTFIPAPITDVKTTSVTVIYPGRPGPARWAAMNADGKSFDVYSGTTLVQHVDVSTSQNFVSLGTTLR